MLCISDGQIQDMWCPVLYKVVPHHVATFIMKHPDTSVAHQFSWRTW